MTISYYEPDIAYTIHENSALYLRISVCVVDTKCKYRLTKKK